MKKMNLIIAFAIGVFTVTSFADSGDKHNLTSNALAGVLGFFNLEYSYKVSDHLTVGMTGSNGKMELEKIELKGSSYGLISRYYLKPAFDEDSWYAIASINKINFRAKARENGVDYSGDANEVVGSAGFGYHWFWDSFNISLGALATTQSKIELKRSSGEKLRENIDPRMSLDFAIGGKF